MPGVIAVGAINAKSKGLDELEEYSSRGPATFMLPVSSVRLKPDLVALANVSVSGAGGFSKTFSGTSAAAPHVAGVLALLKESYPSGKLRDAVMKSAVDLGVSGPDNDFGAGRIDAARAYEILRSGDLNSVDPPPSEGGKVSAGLFPPLTLLVLFAAALFGRVSRGFGQQSP